MSEGPRWIEPSQQSLPNTSFLLNTPYDPWMAFASAHRDAASTGRGWKRVLLGMGLTIIVIVVLLVVAALLFSGATLAGDSTALARVTVQPLGGKIERVQAFGPDGRRVPLAVRRRAPDAAEAADPGRAGIGGRGGSPARMARLGAGLRAQRAPDAACPGRAGEGALDDRFPGLGRARELRHAGQHGRLREPLAP